MKFMAIGAHPDDIEIFMFGLLSVLKKKGEKIHCIVATDGGKGGTNLENLANVRKKETTLALKNLSEITFLELPDGELGESLSHVYKLRESIEAYKPNLIITHHPNDYHSDHRSLSKIVKKVAGHYIPIIFCDTMMGINFKPNYYVDITECFENKTQSILKHKSQQPDRFVDLIKMMNSYRAAQCNMPKGSYAEAYYYKNSFPFTDIRIILPSSIKIRPFDIDKKKGFL